MLKVIFFCEVNIDGSGDFEHLYTIVAALRNMAALKEIEMYAVVTGGGAYHNEFVKKLDSLKLNQYFINIWRVLNDPDLINHLHTADQVFFISMAGGSQFKIDDIMQLLKPEAIVKFIGEHESDNQFAPKSVRIYRMGLSKGTLGIKLKRDNLAYSDPFEVIAKYDPGFLSALLDHSKCHSIDQFKQTNYFVPAYFQKTRYFFNFLTLFICNNKLPDDTNITVFLSGKLDIDLSEALIELSQSKKYKLMGHKISIIKHFKNGQATASVYSMNEETGTKSILILEGFRLSEEGFEAALAATSFIAGVSGDNTFEKIISKKKLPFYWSSNSTMKFPTLIGLYNIITAKLDNSGLDKEVKQDVLTYFDPEKFQDFVYYGSLKEFQELNLLKIAEVWPIIAEHLIAYHNFYDRLWDIFIEGLDPTMIPKGEKQTSGANVASSLTNLLQNQQTTTQDPPPLDTTKISKKKF